MDKENVTQPHTKKKKKEKKENLTFATTWIDLEDMLSEITQINTILYVITYM